MFASCACAFQISGLITCLECTSGSKVIFPSRLNEVNGGCEKILPASGSFWSNLKFFFRMMDFIAWLWGSNVRAISCCIPMIFYCKGSLNLICTIRWWSLFLICFSLQSTPDNSNPPTNWNIALPKLWFQNQFTLDFSHKFTVISPSFTRTSR